MIVDLGARYVIIEPEVGSAAYDVCDVEQITVPGTARIASDRRVVLELEQFAGGKIDRVLLGGVYEAGGDVVLLRVAHGTPRSRRASVKLRRGRRALRAGLPAELLPAVQDGLSRTLAVPAGVVTVDRAATDPLETSPWITELASELLGKALSCAEGPSHTQVEEWLRALP